MSSAEHITAFTLAGAQLAGRSPEAEHERNVAINDLLHENSFSYLATPCGPYRVALSLDAGRLVFAMEGAGGEAERVAFSPQPLKRLIRDYFLICESYYEALSANAGPHKIEAIDMGRRGVHNEGAEALQHMLSERLGLDFATARRLFTLICVLHLK